MSGKGSRHPRLGMLTGAAAWHPPGVALRDELRLLHHGRDWRGRSTPPRSAEPWVPEVPEKEFPTAWARSPLAVAVRAGLTRSLLRAVVWSQTAPAVEGTSYLNEVRGPVVFVANHSSHLDTPLILGSLPPRFGDRTAVGAAADYFFDTRWRAVTTALLFNAFPVERYGSRRLRSLAADLIDEGWSLLIYPEGTRSEDGWMNPFRLGAAYLCVAKRIPVVPIALCGSYGAMPRGRNWPKPGRPRITVRYGRPIYPEPDEKPGDFRRRMTEAVVRLAAEEQLGWYAAMRASVNGTLEVPGFRSALRSPPAPVAIAGPATASEPGAESESGAASDSAQADADPAAANGGHTPAPGGTLVPAAGATVVPAAGGARALVPRGQDVARWRKIWAATSPAPRRPARRVWR